MRTVDTIHFLPSVFFIVIVVLYLRLPIDEKIIQIEEIYQGSSIFGLWCSASISMFIVYTVLIIKVLVPVYHRENPLHRRILRLFSLFIVLMVLAVFKIIGALTGNVFYWRTASFLHSFALLLLYFFYQRYPMLLSIAHMKADDKKPKGKNILDSVDVESLKKNIEIMMEKEKLFCDEDLSLKRFSHALEVSPHQLSAFLNEHYDKNYNSFINKYRIDYACQLLENDPDMSILASAFASGFNSYTAFFTAFKKERNQSPRQFKNILNYKSK